MINSTRTYFLRLYFVSFAAFFLFTNITQAQNSPKTGKISGKVVDADTGEPIIGVNILITGTDRGTATDINGSFLIDNLAAGTYALRLSYISYATKTITGVKVTAGKPTIVNTSLQVASQSLQEMTITAQRNKNSEAGLLAMRSRAKSFEDGISSEQISKQGDSDVGSALKRVTGVTVQDGKDVFVRGLGNRYSNVQLNGSRIPSTNPNKKEAPVDLFGSDMISNITVQKTYTADQSAEFSGGSVQIVTREFPDQRNFSVSYTTKYNTVSTFNETLSSKGSSTDFLGYDNGFRKLPRMLKDARVSAQNTNQVIQSLNNNWAINKNVRAIPSQKVSINYADQYNEDNMPIGLVSNFSYEYNRQFQPNKIQRSILNFNDNGVNYYSNYDQNQGVQGADISGMVNLFTKPSSVTKVGLKTLYTNSENDTRNILQGPYQNGVTRIRVIDFDQRTVFSSTLQVQTFFENFVSSTLSGHLSYNIAQRKRPDRRTTRYNKVGKQFLFQPFGDGNGHFYSDQTDNNYEGRLKYKIQPFHFLDVSIGGNAIFKDRTFKARRLSYRDQTSPYLSDSLKALPADQVLANKNLTNGPLELVETTQFQADIYNGNQSIYAGFITTKWNATKKLSLNVGGRVEQSVQTIDVPSQPNLTASYKQVSRVDNTDFLPAVNVRYALTDQTNLRAAFSKTLARPAFREISNFDFADFFGGRRIYGNPKLKRTKITNYDLKWETYPSGGELFAISGFYKHFENPIELFYRFTENNEVFYNNAKNADLYGIEFEGRKKLTPQLQLIANGSYIYSKTNVRNEDAGRVANPDRPMVGQSPYTVNVSAFYSIPVLNTKASLSYNTFGKRIVTVGRNTQRNDEYEKPFNDLSAKIDYDPGRIKFSLEVHNMLMDIHQYKQGGVTTFRYDPGVTFELGVKLSL